MKFLDFFSGIGGFRLGLEANGFECVGHCEIDKYANLSYGAIHETKGQWFSTDITAVRADELPEADIYCAGFPCQAFSIAGNRGGFEDTRGTLVFEVLRLAKERKPKLLFFENVKGLLSHDNGKTFSTILAAISELGYDVEWQLLNSINFGVPQNRERVFIIGHLRGECRRPVFPITGESSGTLTEITGITKHSFIIDDTNEGFSGVKKYNYAPTLRSERSGLKITLQNLALYDGIFIRKLTPLEYWRLQGFPDEAFYKAQKVCSNSQLYKQAGNSVTVNVIKAIGQSIKESYEPSGKDIR